MKRLLIVVIAVLLLSVGFSGCTEINRYGNDKESNDYSDDNSWDESDNGFGGTETIVISGTDTVRVVNYLDKPVVLIVSGVRNDVTVGKETDLVEVILSGVDNIVRVSRSHSFTQIVGGVRPKIVYYDYDNWDGYDEIETIEICAMKTVETVNYLDKPVKLIVSGMECDITVTKETDLKEVIISGMESVVRVSRHHSFTSTIIGMKSEIMYYD